MKEQKSESPYICTFLLLTKASGVCILFLQFLFSVEKGCLLNGLKHGVGNKESHHDMLPEKESYAKFRVGTMTTVAMFINKYQWLRNIYS